MLLENERFHPLKTSLNKYPDFFCNQLYTLHVNLEVKKILYIYSLSKLQNIIVFKP